MTTPIIAMTWRDAAFLGGGLVAGAALAGAVRDVVGAVAKDLLLPAWVGLTYWPVRCRDCSGTGICTRKNSKAPHSCCGDCKRRVVPASQVPKNFEGNVDDGRALIGDGLMYIRPWAPRRQVQRPL